MVLASIAGIALLIIIYLMLKAQGLNKNIEAYRRQVGGLQQEVQHIFKITEKLAYEQQQTFRKSINRAKQYGHPDAELLKYTEIMIDALVTITEENARGHKNVPEAFKKFLARKTDASYTDFTDFISKQDENVKTEWHKKTVSDYYVVCQLLIDQLNGVNQEG